MSLQGLGRAALEADGQSPAAAALLVSVDTGRKLFRLAYDGPHTYGPAGAQWYREHQSLAASLSSAFGATVHAYAFDPDRFEAVTAYGAGAPVGGETLVYEERDLEVEELSDEEFEALRDSWPMGRLARVLGLSREELLRLPYVPGTLLSLEGPEVDLASLLPQATPPPG